MTEGTGKDPELEAERPHVAFGELSDVDLDEIEDVGDDALYGHFHGLASRASEGQLREALGIGPSDEVMDHAGLVHEYAARRSSLARRMRALRA